MAADVETHIHFPILSTLLPDFTTSVSLVSLLHILHQVSLPRPGEHEPPDPHGLPTHTFFPPSTWALDMVISGMRRPS